MELEAQANFHVAPPDDRRPRMQEPLPVRLVAVADVRLRAPAGVEGQLAALYVRLLQFQPLTGENGPVYRADNFCLYFEIVPGPLLRGDYRQVGIEVASLGQTERKLIEAEIEYTPQKATVPGRESLVLLDPAGNWIELLETVAVR